MFPIKDSLILVAAAQAQMLPDKHAAFSQKWRHDASLCRTPAAVKMSQLNYEPGLTPEVVVFFRFFVLLLAYVPFNEKVARATPIELETIPS